MNKLKKKLKISACVGFRNHKEDCNISNFSEGQTVDSGIVSDQSSRQEHRISNLSNEKPINIPLFLSHHNGSLETFSYSSNIHNSSKNLSSIKENYVSNSLNKSYKANIPHKKPVDFGPIHPYMHAVPFYKYQCSDAYNTVASSSTDSSQSLLSELFIPLKKISRKMKNKDNLSEEKVLKRIPSDQSDTIDILWNRLPSKILIRIFRFLSIRDIGRCSQVCFNWYFIAWQPILWDVIDFTSYTHDLGKMDVNQTMRSIITLLGGIKKPICPLIHSIKLDKCATVTDETLILISNSCQNLKHLSVKKCYLISNIAIFHILSKCRMLTRLNVEGCKLISSINTIPDDNPGENQILSLKELNLSNCPLIDDASLSILSHRFRNLNKLLIRNCKRITNIGLEYISRYCLQIHQLSLNNIARIDDNAIINISLKINENLHYLSLANCGLISDNSLNHLSENCHKLGYLNLHKCRLISDSGVMSLAISLQFSLVSLSLSYCDKITNKSLSVISRYCSKIEQLDLNHCVNITDQGLEESFKHFKTLTLINIDNTSATVTSLDLISSKFQNCNVIHNFVTDC